MLRYTIILVSLSLIFVSHLALASSKLGLPDSLRTLASGNLAKSPDLPTNNIMTILPGEMLDKIFLSYVLEESSHVLKESMRVCKKWQITQLRLSCCYHHLFTAPDPAFLINGSQLRILQIPNEIKISPTIFSKLPHLIRLELCGGNFDDPCAGVQALTQLTELKYLLIEHNLLGPTGAHGEMKELTTTLETLFIRDNKLGPQGMMSLTSFVNLTKLDIAHNEIGPNGLEPITVFTKLAILYTDWNGLGETDIPHITSLSNLTELNIGYNYVMYNPLPASVFKDLCVLKKLKVLNVCGCSGEMDKTSKTLKEANQGLTIIN